MKSENKKQSSIYVITLFGILLTIFLIYSCSTDEYNYTNETATKVNSIAQTRSLVSQTWNTGNVLIDSVANSDEFYEFERCSEQLADKFSAYTSKLNNEEYDKLMESLNDDEYMEDFIKKANLEEELRQMDEAKKGLLERTVFLRLSEEERLLLFRQYAKSRGLAKRKILKTRKEGNGNSKCEELRQAAYEQAKTEYDNAIATNCKGMGPLSPFYLKETAVYKANIRIANKDYENCINNQ